MIKIWQVGNTGVRNPMRIHEAFQLYAGSNLVGKIRGVDGAVAFTNYLCEKGILNNAPGKDPTGSYGRKWRFVFNLNGFTYCEAKGMEFSQSDIGPVDTITPFGRSFLSADSVPSMQEFFLRAMSMRMTHSGAGCTFSPLRWTLAVMLEVESLVGDSSLGFSEFAAFVQTSTPESEAGSIAEKIVSMRNSRQAASSKKRFDRDLFETLGKDYPRSSNNFREYADMNLRYLKATGIVKSSGKGIVIVPEKHALAEMLAETPSGNEPAIERYKTLYDGPSLPTDNVDAARRMLYGLKERLLKRGIAFSVEEYDMSSAAAVNAARHRLESILAADEEIVYAHMQKDQWREISDYMTLIMSRGGRKQYDDETEISVPKDEVSAYLEWTVWRAFLAMNTLENKPYEIRRFKIDQDFLPVSTAPGNGPDMIAEYNSCKVVIEVTMSDNSRQEAMEGEPVRRHVYDVLHGGNKPVYGLFVANRVNTNTAETFRVGTWYANDDARVRLNIVPLSLKQFQEYFVSVFRDGNHKNGEIVTFLNDCVKMRDNGDAVEWRRSIAAGLASSICCRTMRSTMLTTLETVPQELRFREYLPVYSLRAACGHFGDGEEVEPDGWMKVKGCGRLDDTQFVVKTEGASMEGLIEEGSYAIFRRLGGNLEGKVLLVQRLEAGDPDSGGAYTIKKFTRKGGKVVLKARNPEVADIVLESDAEYSTRYRAIAEFKGVLP